MIRFEMLCHNTKKGRNYPSFFCQYQCLLKRKGEPVLEEIRTGSRGRKNEDSSQCNISLKKGCILFVFMVQDVFGGNKKKSAEKTPATSCLKWKIFCYINTGVRRKYMLYYCGTKAGKGRFWKWIEALCICWWNPVS